MKDKNKKRKEPVKSRLRQENLKAIKVYSKVNVVDFLHLQQDVCCCCVDLSVFDCSRIVSSIGILESTNSISKR